MNKEFWDTRWTKNEIPFHQLQTCVYLEQYLSVLETTKGNSIFVPLCGKSLDMLYLLQQGYKVLGVEFNEIAVLNFFKENQIDYKKHYYSTHTSWVGENITIIQGDLFQSKLNLRDIAAVYDRASIVALPAQIRKKYAQYITYHLASGSKILLVVFEYEQHLMKGPPFSVAESELQQLFSEAFHLQLVGVFDVMNDYVFFKSRGLTQLVEKVYTLEKK